MNKKYGVLKNDFILSIHMLFRRAVICSVQCISCIDPYFSSKFA